MATKKTMISEDAPSHQAQLGLADVGRLPVALRAQLREWLLDNFGPETDFGCAVTELPGGGLSLTDDGGDTDEGDFAVHVLADAVGEAAFVAVMFGPLGEGALFDARAGGIVARVLEGQLRDVAKGYVDVAPALSRLIPGVTALPAPRPRAAVPAGSPRSVADWRALFPEAESQRTIDLLVEGLTQARSGAGSTLHSFFARDTGLPLSQQPEDPVEWLLAAKRLLLSTTDPFETVTLGDVRPLGIFRQLRELEVRVTADTELSALGGLSELRALSVEGAERSDWSWLGSLEHLEKLEVGGGEDVGESHRFGVQGNPRLVSLSWSAASDLSSLGGSSSLEELKLIGSVEDLTPLRGFPNLTSLEILGTNVRDISPLLELKKLRALRLVENRVTSLEGLERLEQLVDLDVEWNCIGDFSPIHRWLTDEDEAREWIEEASATQLDVSSAEGRALLDDWYDLDKWRALAEHLTSIGDPLGEQIQLRLDDQSSDLPWHWGRAS